MEKDSQRIFNFHLNTDSSKAFGFEDAPIPQTMNHGPFITGIHALGPRSKRIITWGHYGGLLKGMGEKTIDVTINYKSDGLFRTWSRAYSRICPIDIKSFEGTDAHDLNWDKKQLNTLKIYL